MEDKPQGAEVHLSLYNLIIEVRQDGVYPDQINDMVNRAVTMFREAIQVCKEQQLDIRDFELEDEE